MHGHVLAHQNFALRLLEWLRGVLDMSVGFRALFSKIMLEKAEDGGSCSSLAVSTPFRKVSRLEDFLRHDTALWKAARIRVRHIPMLVKDCSQRFAIVK